MSEEEEEALGDPERRWRAESPLKSKEPYSLMAGIMGSSNAATFETVVPE